MNYEFTLSDVISVCVRAGACMCEVLLSLLLLLLALCVSVCAAVSHPRAVPAAVRPRLLCALDNLSFPAPLTLRVIG